MDFRILLTFMTFFYISQAVHSAKENTKELIDMRSPQLKTSFGEDMEESFEDRIHDGAQDAANKALIAEAVAKTYGHEAHLKEQKASEFGSKALLHEHFADVYIKMAKEFENKAKERVGFSEHEINKAKSHEKGSFEFSEKAKELEEQVVEEEHKGGEHLNSYIQEYWSSNIAENNAKATLAYVKIEDARAKGEFIKYAELEKLAHVLLNEAKAYEELGKMAQKNALRYKRISEEKDNFTSQFIAQALRYLIPRASEMRKKAKIAYNSYLDNMLKAEREHELAREEQLKAAHEIKLANAYLRNAQQNLVFAALEKDRFEASKDTVQELSKSLYEPSTAEILVASKSVLRKSVRILPESVHT